MYQHSLFTVPLPADIADLVGPHGLAPIYLTILEATPGLDSNLRRVAIQRLIRRAMPTPQWFRQECADIAAGPMEWQPTGQMSLFS